MLPVAVCTVGLFFFNQVNSFDQQSANLKKPFFLEDDQSKNNSYRFVSLVDETFEHCHPAQYRSQFQWHLRQLVFDSLLHEDDIEGLKPRLAQTWSWNRPLAQVDFELFDSLFWSNGEDLKPQQVVDSFKWHLTAHPDRTHRRILSELISGVEVIDQKTIRFQLKLNNYYAVRAIGLNYLVFPPAVLGLEGPQLDCEQVSSFWQGSGPFLMLRFERDQGVLFKYQPQSWRSFTHLEQHLKWVFDQLDLLVEPKHFTTNQSLKTIGFRQVLDQRVREKLLLAGQANQMRIKDFERLKFWRSVEGRNALQKSDVSIKAKHLAGKSGQLWLAINFKHEALNLTEFRKKLYKALPLSQIRQKHLLDFYQVARGFFPAAHPFASSKNSSIGTDRERTDDALGRLDLLELSSPIRLIYQSEDYAPLLSEIERIWQSKGIPVQTELTTPHFFSERLANGNYELALVEIDRAFRDLNPRGFIQSMSRTPQFSESVERELSDVFDRLATEDRHAQRADLMQRVDRIFFDELVHFYLFDVSEAVFLFNSQEKN